MTEIALPSGSPRVAASAFVATGAVLIGEVTLAASSSVWFNAVLRADNAPIALGEGSNLQDLVACHVDEGTPLDIGAGVSVGHGAVLHGCTVEDGCLIGMHATVMNRAVIGAESLVAAGALITEGTVIPPRSLVAGVPGKVRRALTDDEVASLRVNAAHYEDKARLYAAL